MSLIVVNQGEEAFLDLILAVNMDLRLFTNDVTSGLTPAQVDALDETDFTEATFAGYTASAITGGTWTTTPGDPTVGANTQRSFIRSSTGTAQNIWGYYLTRTSDGALMWFEQFSAPVIVEFLDDEVQVTPQITLDDKEGNVTVGDMTFWPSDTIPANKLLCDGSAVSRTTYAELFAVIGTTYGVGDGSTTFNLPDMEGKFPLGKAAAGTGSVLGETGGAIDHVHDLDTASSFARINISTSEILQSQKTGLPTWQASRTGTTSGSSSSTNSTSGSSLGGDSDTANPPYLAGNWVIQALAG